MTLGQHPHPKQATKQTILQSLLKQGQITAQVLAESLEISPQAIRRHLRDLEAEGMILHQTVQAGMGRPQHVYQLSPKGRERLPQRFTDQPTDGYGKFATSLLDVLEETVGREQVSSILRKQWERKALDYRDRIGSGSLQERIAHLVELRNAEGYMTEWYAVEASDLEGMSHPRFVVTEYNCAISYVAESFPSVCGHELELFAFALPDCQVERTHWLIKGEHRCGYLIQPQATVLERKPQTVTPTL